MQLVPLNVRLTTKPAFGNPEFSQNECETAGVTRLIKRTGAFGRILYFPEERFYFFIEKKDSIREDVYDQKRNHAGVCCFID